MAQPKVGSIEEDHLPELRVEQVQLQRHERGPLIGIGHNEFELDVLYTPQETQDLHWLLAVRPQTLRNFLTGRHYWSVRGWSRRPLCGFGRRSSVSSDWTSQSAEPTSARWR